MLSRTKWIYHDRIWWEEGILLSSTVTPKSEIFHSVLPSGELECTPLVRKRKRRRHHAGLRRQYRPSPQHRGGGEQHGGEPVLSLGHDRQPDQPDRQRPGRQRELHLRQPQP